VAGFEGVVMASCVEAMEEFLASNPAAAGTPEAAAALAAAEAIDGARASRLSGAAMQGEASMVGRFLDLLEVLRELAPPARAEDRLDELARKRALRRAAS
jgi:hypothetical protein